ncbi:DoxX family protein [Actinoplanes sp. NPDC051513]|uniref:DoxX family protein n=1 Tax=Actinoplanes sp. NPDC051513 TaxID=3363908 RepID=UPI0037B5EB0A
MNVVLWIIASLLAVAFAASGLMKVLLPKERLKAQGMGWVDDWDGRAVKVIGVLEVLAAVGLILPAALDIAPVLVPLAATGLAIIMVGAIVVHARRKEYPVAIANVVLLILTVVVAWGRFGPYSF